jgi:FixJ family two-component response regulator
MTETDAMVFVVDDDAPMRESLKNLIRSVGLRAELFASAQEFLRSKRGDVPICLVLDVRLPGLNGLDLQRRTLAPTSLVRRERIRPSTCKVLLWESLRVATL